jgi:hypothetical protein
MLQLVTSQNEFNCQEIIMQRFNRRKFLTLSTGTTVSLLLVQCTENFASTISTGCN